MATNDTKKKEDKAATKLYSKATSSKGMAPEVIDLTLEDQTPDNMKSSAGCEAELIANPLTATRCPAGADASILRSYSLSQPPADTDRGSTCQSTCCRKRRRQRCSNKKAAEKSKKATNSEAKATKGKPEAKGNIKTKFDGKETSETVIHSRSPLGHQQDCSRRWQPGKAKSRDVLEEASDAIEDATEEDADTDLEWELDSEGRWRPYHAEEKHEPEEVSDKIEEYTEDDDDI